MLFRSSVNGPPPIVQPGRDASQFARAIDRQVATIYRLGDVEYETQETRVQDPLAMLYSSLKEKLKHAPYASKFERFLCDDWKIYIELAKHYLDDDAIIKHVGKREAINIKEFKATVLFFSIRKAFFTKFKIMCNCFLIISNSKKLIRLKFSST